MNRGELYWQRPVPAHPLVVLRPEASQGPGQPCAKRHPAARLQPASQKPHPRRRAGTGRGRSSGKRMRTNMGSYLNRAQLIGNLGRDPEVRALQNGGSIVTLSLATSESWTDKQSGKRVEKTEWHRVVIFNEPLGKLAERYLVKGSKVFIEGQIKTRKWTDNQNVERYSTEIHLTPYNGTLTFLDNKRDGDDRAPSRESATAGAGGSTGADLDDDIPFGPCWQ